MIAPNQPKGVNVVLGVATVAAYYPQPTRIGW